MEFFCDVAAHDTYGHDMGDEVIKLVARGILKSCRELDTVGRRIYTRGCEIKHHH